MPATPANGVVRSWMAPWNDRWLALRDRLLASPVFRRRAAGFALTAPLARTHARELFDLVAGFVYSQVLLACVQLRLFEVLAQEPQTLAALSKRFDLPAESIEKLVAAAVALRLVEARSDARFGLGALGGPMVGNTAIVAMIEHHAALYADLANPLALLRGRPASALLANYWPYSGTARPGELTDASVAEYSALMSASQPLVADEILDACSLAGHRCLLDIGGGDGGFLASAAQRYPALQLMLFDLPAVAERARLRRDATGLAGKMSIVGGDFFKDALPRGADVASLVRVVHDHDDDAAMRVLRAVKRALPAGGTLLLAEPMAATPGAQAMGDAYFGMYLLAMGSGRPRTVETLRAMLLGAGFERIRQLRTRMPLQTGLLIAHAGLASPDAAGV